MKKLISILAVMVLIVAAASPAFAAETDANEVLAALRKTALPTEYITAAETWLAANPNAVNSTNKTQIIALINQSSAAAGSATKIDDLDSQAKSVIAANIAAVADLVDGLVAVVDNDAKTVTIKATTGTVLATSATTSTDTTNTGTSSSAANPIKRTGVEFGTAGLITVSLVFAGLVAAAVALQKKKEF